MDVRETLRQAVEMGASDIFIIAGLPLTYKVDGRQRRMEARLMPQIPPRSSRIFTRCADAAAVASNGRTWTTIFPFRFRISDVSGRMFCISAAALRRSFV